MFLPQFVDADDVLLHVEADGPDDGPAVLFLHGWPDLWFTFEPQMNALVEQGYRVLAPDQRGYGLSSKPATVADYAMPKLTRDIVLLIERQKLGPIHLVGHDWGGAVAWALAIERPDLVRSLTVVNCPHPQVFAEALLRRPSQMLRSWYMLAFQIPGLAEAVLGARDGAVLASMLRRGARLSDADLKRHRAVWRHPGTVQRPLLWYRAMFRTVLPSIRAARSRSDRPEMTVRVPTQIIWGRRDGAFDRNLAAPSAAMCVESELHWLDTRHWPHREEPRRVTELLTAWCARHADRI
ncbi:alpha/beta fold hydrolase [Actinomadura rayongensis]|uniref:Alpha/beta fold hydrolase n=1 Tax=Actinomadura rayongensis TaxID=1429076 RepID=A0A6I4WE12_9ACTN|nr:alpha/beta fold hydrolase [Actinomadura rayongensis]MXQ65234.1 alpha/beta fold hydrolase [Actinomadura rayongensis]